MKTKISNRYSVIAPMGDNMDALSRGMDEFPTEKVILISSAKLLDDAEKLKASLESRGIYTKVVPISGKTELENWEETFKSISELNSIGENSEILVNTATGDPITRCAATTAAFVNGLKAFTISEDRVLMLPLMKFSYYKMITDRKMEILKLLSEAEYFLSLEDLSKKAQMSKPLISYHINGNLKSEGLKKMGLVEVKEEENRTAVELSTLGRIMVGGYASASEI
jgi:DNA-binding transcriptional ArsR family regulator